MSTELVKKEPALPVAEDVVVLARDPQEMEDAQQGLIAWMDRKIAVLQQELHDGLAGRDPSRCPDEQATRPNVLDYIPMRSLFNGVFGDDIRGAARAFLAIWFGLHCFWSTFFHS